MRFRLLASLLALALLGRASANPADPLSEDAPTFDSAKPEASAFELGDYAVSDKTGAASYTIFWGKEVTP